jgi:hypothetical protein
MSSALCIMAKERNKVHNLQFEGQIQFRLQQQWLLHL